MENKPQGQKEKLSPFIAKWLRKQLDFWANKGILNQSQKDNIKSLYIWPEQEVTPPSKEKPSINLIVVLEAIGAFLIGAGVISFVAFNWPRLPNFTKLILIIIAVVSAHLTGFFILSHRPKFQKAGFSFIFLGNIFYGAGIWLVAQMYHIQQAFPTGVFLWALGILPFAYVVKSKLNYFLAVALFILWTLGESIGFQKPHLVFLLILLGLLGPLSYYLKSKVGLSICIITGGMWLLINNIFWFGKSFSIYLFLPLILYGIILLAASNLHLIKDTLKEYRRIYLYIGTSIFSVTIFLMPFFGMVKLSPQALTLRGLSLSFWVCSSVLLAGSLACKTLINRERLDKVGSIINKILPYLLVAALYVLIMPQAKPLLILALFPVILVAFTHWYFSKSRILPNLLLFYFVLWLPFCLIKWEQPLMLFLLFLVYGAACYLLGWTYISKFQDKTSGDLFKFFGLLVVFISLYTFAFSQISEIFAKDYELPTSFDFWLLALLFYAGALFLYRYVARFKYPLQKRGMLPEERIIAPILLITPLVLFIVFSNKLTGFWYTFSINSFYLCLLIVFLVDGYRRRELILRILSFTFLVILIGTRYLEIEWSLLYKSMLFTFTGIIILVAGILLEKNKDKVALIE
ncbi:DUF2157 domain-containing protein [bacterium]|nr:DUF2157 domain-containing protein [bacterium]